MTTKEAMDHLAEVMRTDAEYREGWKANIAMAFKDQFMYGPDRIDTEYGLHLIANKAANRFIEQISPTKPPTSDELDGMAALVSDCHNTPA